MHPDQFTVLNSNNPKVVGNSVMNLAYHTSHQDYISANDCKMVWELYKGRRVDVMVEAKKKEKAALGLLSFLNKSSANKYIKYHKHRGGTKC